MRRSIPAILAAALLASLPGAALAQATWPKPEARLYIGNLNYWWGSQIKRAADEWSDATVFDFNVKGDDNPACDKYDSGVLLRPEQMQLLNGVEFGDEMCFLEQFPEHVLAVCVEITGPTNGMLQKGLIFNEDYNWKVFHGPNGDTTFDFHRVAVHELGHFLGLGHNESEASIMAPIVSDEIEDIQPADVDAANGAYTDTAEEAEEAEADPLVTCEVRQLAAASKLCKRQLRCQARYAKDPAVDPDARVRDGCMEEARGRFAAAWDAAVADGEVAGGCFAQDPGIDVAPMVGASTAGAIGLIGEGDPANEADLALRTKLLKRSGALCKKAVRAWKKDAVVSDEAKLATRLARSRARFAESAAGAVARAASKGVRYDGADGQLIADELESLASDLGTMTGPE